MRCLGRRLVLVELVGTVRSQESPNESGDEPGGNSKHTDIGCSQTQRFREDVEDVGI
jgi:hypothetical protein